MGQEYAFSLCKVVLTVKKNISNVLAQNWPVGHSASDGSYASFSGVEGLSGMQRHQMSPWSNCVTYWFALHPT